MIGLNGGLMGARRIPQPNSATGIWTANEVTLLKRENAWINDPYWSNVSLLLHMDGTNGSTSFADNSLNNTTITANGNAQVSTAQSKFGGASGLFDGTNDYLSAPDSDNWHFGSGNFTVETWFRIAGNMTNESGFYYSALACQDDSVGGRGWILRFQGTSTSYTSLQFSGFSNNSTSTTGQITQTFSQGVWYHVAAVRSGNNLYMFLDGVLMSTTAFSLTIQNVTGNLKVGAGQYDSTFKFNFNGYIDEVRITKGIARYTSTFVPQTTAFPNA